MTKNTEIEAKTLLTKTTYQQLCAAFPIKSDFLQANYYFDTPDGLLKQHHISCRVRIFKDHAEQTLKVPHSQLIQHNFHEAVEINDDLELAAAQKFVQQAEKGTVAVFNSNVERYLRDNLGTRLELYLQTFNKTRRILAVGPENCELTLDATTYPDSYIDYELEIENSNPTLIKKVLIFLENDYNFKQTKTNTNQPKIARAFSHRVRR
ncbi:CYTH domain-containing protein [Lactobacillus sp. ESL0701]|uniref:CYTH domain-containing protein n=1 Tax=Lactobacillus sp. ESL0701 TaxID=2983217 RepID=UPI0023F81720|nr:CYTH domain-containing protein [Lactobacillus sp. ESL0701]MDF7672330.1 CYTH domain-containing protein [Lactobacillus sp. ESL0701]